MADSGGERITVHATVDVEGRLLLPPEVVSALHVGPGGVIEFTLDRGSAQIVTQLSPETLARLMAMLTGDNSEQDGISDEDLTEIVDQAKTEVFEVRYRGL